MFDVHHVLLCGCLPLANQNKITATRSKNNQQHKIKRSTKDAKPKVPVDSVDGRRRVLRTSMTWICEMRRKSTATKRTRPEAEKQERSHSV